MKFLTTQDLTAKLTQSIYDQLIQDNADRPAYAEIMAIAYVTDMLNTRYNLDVEYAKTGTNRHQNLLRWTLCITAYILYEHIHDNETPTRIVKDYDDTVKHIQSVAAGKTDTSLTNRYTNSETQTKKTRFRWGSQPARTHQ